MFLTINDRRNRFEKRALISLSKLLPHHLVVYFRFILNHLFEATAHKYYEALILPLPLHSNEIKQDRKIMILKKSSMSAELILSRPLGRLFQSRSRKKRKKQETFFSCWQILIIFWQNFALVIKQIMESWNHYFVFFHLNNQWENESVWVVRRTKSQQVTCPKSWTLYDPT